MTKKRIVIPLSLIQELKIFGSEIETVIHIGLRYGNNLKLVAGLKQGTPNLQNVNSSFKLLNDRVKYYQGRIAEFWLKEYRDLFKIHKYKNPCDSVKIRVQNYILGMNKLLKELNHEG